jgi:hypothetical protein
MNLYRIIVFCHVAATLALFGALAIEWVSLRSLRQAESYEQAREWMGLWRLLAPLGAPFALVILASGIYLARTIGAWTLGWVEAAVPTLVIAALAGGIVGPRRNRLQAAVATRVGPLPGDLLMQLRQPMLLASWRFRAALLTGLVFDMTVKPASGGALVMAVVALAGIGWGLLTWTGAPARVQQTVS